MDYIIHGILGGLLYSLPTKFIFSFLGIDISPLLLFCIFAWGFIEGSWPDAGNWILYKFGFFNKGYLYTLYHVRPYTTAWKYFPAFMLHVKFVDPIFHKRPDHISQEAWIENAPGTRNWWSWLWWLCIIYWVIALIGLYLLFFV